MNPARNDAVNPRPAGASPHASGPARRGVHALGLAARLERAGATRAAGTEALDQIDSRLSEISRLLRRSDRDGSAGLHEVRARIDESVRQINAAAGAGAGSAAQVREVTGYSFQPQLPEPEFAFVSAAPNVEAYSFGLPAAYQYSRYAFRVSVERPWEAGAIDLVLTSSTALAPILNLGGPGPSDGANEVFAVHLSGVRGGTDLSFASGTTLASIADGINSTTETTGVRANLLSDGRIQLRGLAPGDSDFVSVRVIDDGNIGSGPGRLGIHGPGGIVRYSEATTPVTDYGNEMVAHVYGHPAVVNGTSLVVEWSYGPGTEHALKLRLDPNDFTNPGLNVVGGFYALTVQRATRSADEATPPAADALSTPANPESAQGPHADPHGLAAAIRASLLARSGGRTNQPAFPSKASPGSSPIASPDAARVASLVIRNAWSNHTT